MKKILLLTILVAGSFVHAMHDQKIANMPKEQTVIALDLHGVALTFSIPKLISRICGFLVSNPSHTLILPLNPLCWYRVYHILKTTPKAAEVVYDKLTQDYYPELSKSKKEFLMLCNPYDVHPEMAKLVTELKAQKYRLAVCSNIGKQAFDVYRPEYPDFFDKFEVIGTAAPENDYARKPEPAFFEWFKATCQQKLGQQELRYVFADDNEGHVISAQKSGLNSFVFKNPQEFRSDLKNSGIEIA